METPPHREYHLRDLGTRCVTLFPTRALIVRDIKNVTLKPGANQITVVGLSPTVDEQSIKVEGTGSAIITDIEVELLPNRDIFRDFYPDLDSDASSDESEAEDDQEDDDSEETAVLEAVRDKLALVLDEEKRGRELVISAETQVTFLDQFCNRVATGHDQSSSLDGKDKGPETSSIVESIAPSLDTYRKERTKAFEDYMDGLTRQREALKNITKLRKEESRLLKQAEKRKSAEAKKKAKELKSRQKEKAKAARQKLERSNEKERKRRERASFWPRKMYTLKISLDAGALTPTSRRRGSVSGDAPQLVSVTELVSESEKADTACTCDLTFSYMTDFAFWAPAYDLVVSTTETTGHLCFDALLTNATSETWSGCKVVLSTSHADSSNLDEDIPDLKPWRVTLAQEGHFLFKGDATYSKEERLSREKQTVSRRPMRESRHEMFGVDPVVIPGRFTPAFPPKKPSPFGAQPPSQTARAFGQPASGGFGQPSAGLYPRYDVGATPAIGGPAPNTGGGLFGGAAVPEARPAVGGLFGAKPSSSASQNQGGLFGSSQNQHSSGFGSSSQPSQGGALFGQRPSSTADVPSGDHPQEEAYLPESAEASTSPGPQPELAFAESAFEEAGFTTTYDLPGLKTLGPSSTASKQRVARISFPAVTFQHKVVAKHKAAAYLSVKLRNSDQMTLLKARTGLTLDGTFLGRTLLPRCSPGEWFTLNLGVDPAIGVTYAKPEVKHGRTGLAVFNKENSDVYSRAVTLANTRSGAQGRPVRITVLDQVPLSEDERLRVVVLQPDGLRPDGPGVPAGVAAGGENEEKAWGKAVATLKEGGEVAWDVSLNAGCKVKLPLEYQCALPSGYHVINA